MDLIRTLKSEQELLLGSISKARSESNVGTYKNLIQALRDITRLIRDEEYADKGKENYDRMYFECDRETVTFYFAGGIYRFSGADYEFISNKISSMASKDVEIYGDIRGVGLGIADHLKRNGFNNICDTKIHVCNLKNMKIIDTILRYER